MSPPTRFNIGDIIERVPTNDPYEHHSFQDLYNKYGMLTYLVMDIQHRYINTLDKYITTYKLMCMQNNEVQYGTLREKNAWRKLA